jgi:DNA-binding NarL/FixJ family response regulator
VGLLIAAQPDMELLGEAGTADQVVTTIEGHRRTAVVVLAGLALAGDHDAFWLIRTVRERFPSQAILGIGANADPRTISRTLFVGADGFVDKNVTADVFLDAIRAAASHEMVLAGPEPDDVGAIARVLDARRDLDIRLTEREREVLVVAAEGLTAREIAERLGVRERTITTHLGRIYGKLGVGNRLSAIRTAARSGLVTIAHAE